MTPSAALLVFVPGLGFISSDAKMLREPVTERIDDWEVELMDALVHAYERGRHDVLGQRPIADDQETGPCCLDLKPPDQELQTADITPPHAPHAGDLFEGGFAVSGHEGSIHQPC